MSVLNLAILEAIYNYVDSHPGCSKYAVAKKIGIAQGHLDSRMASMEKTELKLCEDSGMLYSHSRYGVMSRWFLEEMFGV